MSVNERGDYHNAIVDEWGNRVFTLVDELGDRIGPTGPSGQQSLILPYFDPKTQVEQGYLNRWPGGWK